MQLLILLAMLFTGGNNVDNLFKEVQPLLKDFGGEDMQNTLKQAEELYGIVSALQGLNVRNSSVNGDNAAQSGKNGGFALAPIAEIADNDIICRMTKYIADDT